MRGRTFAFVQTMVRVVLVLTLAVAPLLAAAFGQHQIEVTDAMSLTYNGAAITFLLAGLLAAVLGITSYRHMDDRRGVPLPARPRGRLPQRAGRACAAPARAPASSSRSRAARAPASRRRREQLARVAARPRATRSC